MARSKGRSGRPWRRVRAQVLAASRICWLCGHDGADTVDHVIPLSLGGDPLDLANLRAAHGVRGCPTCGRKCNSARGNRMTTGPAPLQSRAW
ncbi:HNH endonuclease [Nonomuraea sp. CA-141351]|uniref:HNH endonuclease n=1 Tax=Nonomuraea sp. CA-141351 TaxID=3239996 RepID=UPI003D915CB1